MDSWCTGPASIITEHVYNAKNKVLTTQECTVLHFRSDVGPPPAGGSAPVRSRERLHAATAASPAPTSLPVTASTCQAHHSPWWSSSRAVTAAAARSERVQRSIAVDPTCAAHTIAVTRTDRSAATVASRAHPSPPQATTTCQAHHPPWWTSRRAATAPSARSNHEQSDIKARRPSHCCDIAAARPRSQRTLHDAELARERTHAYSSRRRASPDDIHPHPVTG